MSGFLFEATTEKQFPLLCNTAHNTKNQNENTLLLKLCDKLQKGVCKCTTCVNGICKKNPRQTIGDKVNNMQLQFGRSRFVHKYGATRRTTPKIKRKIHYHRSNFATNCKKVSANAPPASTAFARKIPDKLSGTK